MNRSLDAVSSSCDNATGRVALCIEVGLCTPILFDKCAMRRGWRPNAENADALSVKGALDGFEGDFEGESDDGM